LVAIYYQWYSDYANMQTAELSYTQNNTLLKNIRGRKRYNIADQSDVDTIHVQVIEKKEDELTLHNTYENTTQLVYQAIGYKGSGSLEPAFSMYRQQLIDFTKEYRVFQENSRTYTMLKLMDEKGTAEVKHSADTLLPSVKLLFGYQKEGEEYRIKNSRENLFAGFSFEFSFWQQQNSALYETTKIDLQKTRLTSAQTKIQLETDLKNIYEEIQLEKRLIRSAEQKIALGQRIVGSETRKYRQARTSLSDLIQVINNLDTYRFEKISHTVKLQTLVIEWLRITDQLVYKNNMVVK
jgi:outer membrane protein TolC